jgi:hypothetical protein
VITPDLRANYEQRIAELEAERDQWHRAFGLQMRLMERLVPEKYKRLCEFVELINAPGFDFEQWLEDKDIAHDNA